jgi:hypothetical protein
MAVFICKLLASGVNSVSKDGLRQAGIRLLASDLGGQRKDSPGEARAHHRRHGNSGNELLPLWPTGIRSELARDHAVLRDKHFAQTSVSVRPQNSESLPGNC